MSSPISMKKGFRHKYCAECIEFDKALGSYLCDPEEEINDEEGQCQMFNLKKSCLDKFARSMKNVV